MLLVPVQQILLGFDIDSCACAYVGPTFWGDEIRSRFVCIPRYVRARTHCINIVNPFRRSLTYEKRGYGILIPGGLTKLIACFNEQMKMVIESDTDSFIHRLVFPYRYGANSHYIGTDIELLFADSQVYRKKHSVEVSDYGIINPEWKKIKDEGQRGKKDFFGFTQRLQNSRLVKVIYDEDSQDKPIELLRQNGFFDRTEVVDPGKQLNGLFHPINDEFFARNDAAVEFHVKDYLASLNTFIMKRSGMIISD
jgi:hypothetical protein